MDEDILTRRRRWFRFFPEGALEFLIVTRVLALLLLLSLMILREAQRPIILVGLVGVLWVDYVLMVWWAAQVAMDLALLEADRDDPPRDSNEAASLFERPGVRYRLILQALLPSVAAAAFMAPWPVLLQTLAPSLREGTAALVLRRLDVLWAAAFVVLALVAYRAVRTMGIRSGAWTVLMMIPGVHWLALHRVAGELEQRIETYRRSRREGRGDGDSDRPTAPLAVTVADAAWVLMMLPWGVVVGWTLVRGQWPEGFPLRMVPFCGTLLAALFAVADLAALEGVQRHFVALLAETAAGRGEHDG